MTNIIVDGSNVIRSVYHPTGKPDFALEASLADSLVYYLQQFVDSGRSIECYFDGKKRYVARPKDMSVFFSAYKPADKLILNSVFEHTQSYGHNVIVVTGDNEIIDKSRSYGADVQYTYDFLKGFIPYLQAA